MENPITNLKEKDNYLKLLIQYQDFTETILVNNQKENLLMNQM